MRSDYGVGVEVRDGDRLDPRVLRTHVAVLSAAKELLVDEGWEAVTVGRVAARSGYARTTLYRHWPHRLDLLRDLIREEADLTHITPSGDLREDLVAEMEAFRTAMTTGGLGRAMIAIGQHARDDPDVAELNRSIRTDGARVLDEIIASAVRRKEIDPEAGSGAAVELLVGPVLFRYLFDEDAHLTRRFIEDVVDHFLRAHRATITTQRARR